MNDTLHDGKRRRSVCLVCRFDDGHSKTFKSVLDLHFTLKKTKRKENVRRNVIHLDLR